MGENIIFRPSVNWRKDAKEEKTEAGNMKDKLKDKKVKCRICSGEHFTARCPFKDTMAPVGENAEPAENAGGAADVEAGPGGLGSGKSSYVPPHMRNGGSGAGDKMGGGGKYERDDLATLRVTNVSRFSMASYDTFTDFHLGIRDGRGARTSGYVRAVRQSHKSFPCKRQRIRTCQGFRFYFVR